MIADGLGGEAEGARVKRDEIGGETGGFSRFADELGGEPQGTGVKLIAKGDETGGCVVR